MTSTPDASLLTRGTSIGHYHVEFLLSSGGFGVVYRVTRDGKTYALKLPLMDDAFEYRADLKITEQRITREVVSLMTLKHPNIVRVHGFDRWPNAETGALYLVMDFVKGLPLLQWLEQAKPTLREAVEVFRTLGLALAEMHRLGVVHRDLKSSNILIAGETAKGFKARWKPVIVDFGLARPAFTHDVTRKHALLGTEGLWAPEQLKAALQVPGEEAGRSPYSAASDLHALGLLFYEALTGRRAFARGGGDLAVLLTAVPRAPRTLNPALPECVDAPVMRLLARNPSARHGSGAELADELGALLEQKDPCWDAVLSPGEATTDDRLGAVTARQRPHPFEVTRQDFAPSLLDSLSPPPFIPRHSDAPRTASVTAKVAHVPAVASAQPAPTPTVDPPLRSGRARSTFRRAAVLTAATALALVVGVAGSIGISHALSALARARSGSTAAAIATGAAVSEAPARKPPSAPAPAAARPPPIAKSPPRASGPVPAPSKQRSARAVMVGRIQPGPIDLVLLEPLDFDRAALPAGTVLTGAAAELLGPGGYRLSFDHARTPAGTTLPIIGSAFADSSAGRRVPLRAGVPLPRVELTVLFESR